MKNIAKPGKRSGAILAISISLLGFGYFYWQHRSVSLPAQEGTSSPSVVVNALSSKTVPQNIARIARSITVRVISEKTGGDATGVLVLRQGNRYQILTCQHVLEGQTNFRILTEDGKEHPARLLVNPNLKNLDLAVLEFTSSTPYQVAKTPGGGNIGTKALATQQPVYAFGFGNYELENGNPVGSTHGKGWRAFRQEAGQVGLVLNQPLQGGYVIGISNEIELGMSGGPLLNQAGEVIGINGRAKYPMQGSSAYQYANGEAPSSELANKLEALSWAIPISLYRQP